MMGSQADYQCVVMPTGACIHVPDCTLDKDLLLFYYNTVFNVPAYFQRLCCGSRKCADANNVTKIHSLTLMYTYVIKIHSLTLIIERI